MPTAKGERRKRTVASPAGYPTAAVLPPAFGRARCHLPEGPSSVPRCQMLPVGADLHHPHPGFDVEVSHVLASVGSAGGVLEVLRVVVHVDDVQQGLGAGGEGTVRSPAERRRLFGDERSPPASPSPFQHPRFIFPRFPLGKRQDWRSATASFGCSDGNNERRRTQSRFQARYDHRNPLKTAAPLPLGQRLRTRRGKKPTGSTLKPPATSFSRGKSRKTRARGTG